MKIHNKILKDILETIEKSKEPFVDGYILSCHLIIIFTKNEKLKKYFKIDKLEDDLPVIFDYHIKYLIDNNLISLPDNNKIIDKKLDKKNIIEEEIDLDKNFKVKLTLKLGQTYAITKEGMEFLKKEKWYLKIFNFLKIIKEFTN